MPRKVDKTHCVKFNKSVVRVVKEKLCKKHCVIERPRSVKTCKYFRVKDSVEGK